MHSWDWKGFGPHKNHVPALKCMHGQKSENDNNKVARRIMTPALWGTRPTRQNSHAIWIRS
eukprot:1161184-Pelagomonas_calceolata.AAC.3